MVEWIIAPLDPFIDYVVDKPPSDSWSNDLYFGPPSNESEMAWNRLIHRELETLAHKGYPVLIPR